MATVLTQVLQVFVECSQPLSMPEIARQLDVPQGMLEGMLQYWVHRGKLREVANDTAQCPKCPKSDTCGIMPEMPRRYELATAEQEIIPLSPTCMCCK